MMLMRVDRSTYVYWRHKGLHDKGLGHDSIYARFVNDVNFAQLIPYIDAEVCIHRKDPLEWLRTGPGKFIAAHEGTWQLPAKTAQQELPEAPATVGIAETSVEVDDDEDLLMIDAPTVRDLPAALQVLRECGLEHEIIEAQKALTGDNASSSSQESRTDYAEAEDDSD